jgi:S-(hydroxymethyl)glutathione dehydrogenase / alcohol dehydrogenase
MKKPRYLKAAVLEKIGRPLKIINGIPIPELNKGQILVKLKYAGICYSQIMEINGLRGKDNYLPHMLGHEGVGKVIDKHTSVKKIKINDWVILTWIKSKGINAKPINFQWKKQQISAGKVTTFSNYTIVSENRVVKKPKSINFKEAVLYGCAIATGSGMILKESKLNKTDFLSISGLGGIGLVSLITAIANNYHKIIAIDIDDKKLKIAEKLGVNYTINPLKENLEKQILKFTKGKMIKVSLDCSGSTNSIENSFKILNSKKGKCIFCSHPPHNKKIKIDPFELIKGKKIEGSWGGKINPDLDFKKISSLLKKTNINISKFITTEYKFDEINKAITDFKKRRIIRPIIKF